VMSQRISALREDKTKTDAIKKLAADNALLQQQLNVLRKERAKQGTLDASQLAETLRAESTIQQKIQDNTKSTNEVFNISPLIAAANQKALEKKQLTNEKIQE